MGEVEESCYVGHFVGVAKVLEKAEPLWCSSLKVVVVVVTVKTRHSQVLGSVPELETMHSLVAVVLSVAVEGAAASLVVVGTGLEPKVAEVELDSALGHWNS